MAICRESSCKQRMIPGKPRCSGDLILSGAGGESNHSSPPEDRPFSVFCGEWLLCRREDVSDSTYVKYEAILRRHILPRLGTYRPEDFGGGLAEVLGRELSEEGLSPKTVKDVLTVLHAVLHFASQRYRGVFPAVELRYPREIRREMRVLSLEEQRRLVDCLRRDMDECKFGVLLSLLTGLRVGELCALRWKNISLGSGTIRVEATMQRLRNLEGGQGRTRVVVGYPKSHSSVRTIPMSDSAAALCRARRHSGPAAFILTGTERYMEPRTVQRRLEKYARECGLEGVHFHTLRHTFATRCMEVGFEIKSLSEILGHASTSITLDRYIHASMEIKRGNMNKLAAVGL